MPRDMRWKQLMHIFGEIDAAYHDEMCIRDRTRSVVAITLPSTPPAAVTNRMGPTVLRVSSVRA